MFVAHKDLTVQQVTSIGKDLLENVRREPFWGRFTRHKQYEAGYSDVSWRKLILKDLTKADIKNLEEGVTPPPTSMGYIEFKTTVKDYGQWIAYTDQSKRYNYDDVVRDAKATLSDDATQQAEWRVGEQFYKGTNTITKLDTLYKTLLKAKTILKKNKAKPVVDRKFIAVLPDEVANDLLVEYQGKLVDTTEKNAMIEGYIGCLGGFILYSRTDEFIYESASAGKLLFFGKSENGLPVGKVSIGDSNIAIFDNGLGSVPQLNTTDADATNASLYPDALHQRGSVGYKVMGFGTRIIDDNAILRIDAYPLTRITEGSVTDENRSHYVRKSVSPTE